MIKRLNKIGIKHKIQLNWMDRTVDMIMAGMDTKTIREGLYTYLSSEKKSENSKGAGKEQLKIAVNLLMNCWASPVNELILFRDNALNVMRQSSKKEKLALHWAMISAAYPFWFNTAKQVGRLLNLQDKVTKNQIVQRLKDQYGDKEAISRNARYVIRTFVFWGILKDSNLKGCYEPGIKIKISDKSIAAVLFECILLCNSKNQMALSDVQSNPVFFPFDLPSIPVGKIVNLNPNLELSQYCVGDEYLML